MCFLVCVLVTLFESSLIKQVAHLDFISFFLISLLILLNLGKHRQGGLRIKEKMIRQEQSLKKRGMETHFKFQKCWAAGRAKRVTCDICEIV